MRLIFINRFYWPDEPATAQLLADLAGALAAAGHSISVVTSLPSNGQLPTRATENGVEVHRVRMSRIGRSSLAARALDFATFFRRARSALLQVAQPGDLLVPMTDPPLIGVMAEGVARRRSARCIHWVQDIFPEVACALASNSLTRAIANSTSGARDRAWRNAAAIVAPGHDMADSIAATGVPRDRIAVIQNWAPAGIVESSAPSPARAGLRDEWNLSGRFVIAYSGNLGRVHELSPLVQLARALSNDRRFAFLFVGSGAGRASLERSVHAANLDNVQFQPAQPRTRLAESLALGDIQCVTLKAGCARLVFPSKLYGIAAVGRPTLFIGPTDCEVARLVRERGLGLAFEPSQVNEAAAAIRTLADDREAQTRFAAAARAFAKTEGNLGHAVSGWSALLTGLAD